MRKTTIRRGGAALAAAGALAFGAVGTAQPGYAAEDLPGPPYTGNDWQFSSQLGWERMSESCRADRPEDYQLAAHYYDGGHICGYRDNFPGPHVNYALACNGSEPDLPRPAGSGEWGTGAANDFVGWRYDLESPTNVVCLWRVRFYDFGGLD
jgi:hypothetical protein